ncbi:hypothetical protein BJY16_005165 [Actinoplanes octamycinicus]|uniref:Uncharacterized protein n=1 Tax=Actinoplanes octamycinicus TaxID=135948 RepID=A0A7W7M9C9_9ACTN|nr:DUF4190 domain-containing protein [Actinoplanes octamycinicus]MBB4741706.1 hypothetical protein [Actinoplanes octamycinicus]GIE57259.1 hypothetical protein Aoc01nite_26610 [Actinoplanes octamycinicus]
MYSSGTGLDPAGGRPAEWDPDLERGPRSDLSGFAVASLVFGLIGGLLLGPLLGVAALVKIKQTGQRGKGLAIAGLVLSGVWVLVLAVVVGVNKYVVNRAEDVVALQIGQCFDLPSTGPEDVFPGPITTLPCTQPHRAEMVGWASPVEGRGTAGDYPGVAALVQRAETGCATISRNYVLDPVSLPAGVRPRWYIPRAAEWARGSYGITCFLATDGAPVSRPLREDASIVNRDQLTFLLAIRDCAESTAKVEALLAGGPAAELRSATKQTAEAWSTMWLKLRAGAWPAEAQPAIIQWIADVDAAQPLWQEAAAATSDRDLRDKVRRAQQRSGADHLLAVRRALGLSTTRGEPLPHR